MKIFFGNCAAAMAMLLTIFLLGCGSEETAKPLVPQTTPPAKVRLAVVDDPKLRTAIHLLRGEWKAQSGSDLEVVTLRAAEIEQSKKLDADAIVYPMAMLGRLADQQLIRPINKSWLEGDPLDSKDLLQPSDALEFSWDGQPYAVPLGGPEFMLFYRADVLERLGKKPPRTWDEYQELIKLVTTSTELLTAIRMNDKKFQMTAEPLAPDWGGPLLLARAAAYAKHRDYISILFDRDTMEPLIAGPPFVRAMTELADAAKLRSDAAKPETPWQCVDDVLNGNAAMAIGIPNHAVTHQNAITAGISIGVAELPGSDMAYNLGHSAWEPRRADEDVHVSLRGISGRVGSVVRGSDCAETAFKLLVWIGGKQWGTELLSSNQSSAPFRQSQLADPSHWTGATLDPAAAKQYGQALASELARKEAVLMPRIPGEMEYMTALNEAVDRVVAGKQSPQEALNQAAKEWKQITERFGVDKQREAYRRSLKTAQ